MKNVVKLLSYNTFIPFFYPALMLPIKPWRTKAIKMMDFHTGDRVIVPGVGTGHDLSAIPKDVRVDGVDISDVMLGLGKIKLKLFGMEKSVTLSKMDAEKMSFDDNTFDKAILSLFLTVVFDARKAFAEIVRVVKPGGQILIFDHLLRKSSVPNILAKPIDTVLSYSFASVTRVLDDIIEGYPVTVEKTVKGDLLGFIEGYLLVKH
ncbi:class I SAM-dependent methyltransferase [Candidatus Magnetominusculus dajiuhuensis]|uniref:class I SAM-dependent methyltransferase n=1 Tax=Candidatus Magnetominusculus dajiuhuensis TaxID=3137712 RepID=UPI003B42C6AA